MFYSVPHLLGYSFEVLERSPSRSADFNGEPPSTNTALNEMEVRAFASSLLKRASSVLTDVEYAACRCRYGYDLSGIIDLTKHITSKHKNIPTLICDALLANIFLDRPRITAIQDEYDLGTAKTYRWRDMIKNDVADLLNSADVKLAPVFEHTDLIKGIKQ